MRPLYRPGWNKKEAIHCPSTTGLYCLPENTPERSRPTQSFASGLLDKNPRMPFQLSGVTCHYLLFVSTGSPTTRGRSSETVSISEIKLALFSTCSEVVADPFATMVIWLLTSVLASDNSSMLQDRHGRFSSFQLDEPGGSSVPSWFLC